HSYEVSEIIALPIVAGSQAYLQWISQQVKP
ncbi:divalent cation tolerance protein CutA, partial [Nodularia spumigena]